MTGLPALRRQQPLKYIDYTAGGVNHSPEGVKQARLPTPAGKTSGVAQKMLASLQRAALRTGPPQAYAAVSNPPPPTPQGGAVGGDNVPLLVSQLY